MSEFSLASTSTRQAYENKYFQEYIRMSGYKPYMSASSDGNKTGVIITKLDRLMRESGQTINIPFIGRLKSGGVTGSTVLEGNEEQLTNFNMPISIDWRRNAVVVPKSESYKTEIDVWNAASQGLKNWESEKVRDDITQALGAVITDTAGTTVNLDAATTANKNFWCANNSDRLLFGGAKSNFNATFATALANVTTSTGKVSAASMSLTKRIAKLADPHIRPYKTETGREYFIAFHGTRSFRDLKLDATIVAANTNARSREGDGMDRNPIFQDGDIIYDGIIHHEVPEIDNYGTIWGLDGAGGSSADVRPVFVCGTGAVGIAWGQMPTMRTNKLRDYEFRPGVAIEELLGVKKMNFNGKQNAIVTAFVAAAADS
jgi:N4-gp56 family major capsid protein